MGSSFHVRAVRPGKLPVSPEVTAEIERAGGVDNLARSWGARSKTGAIKAPSSLSNRNDLCYCGSGRKYKKCCLRADGERKKRPTAPRVVSTGKGALGATGVLAMTARLLGGWMA